jgi:hypothetical protein
MRNGIRTTGGILGWVVVGALAVTPAWGQDVAILQWGNGNVVVPGRVQQALVAVAGGWSHSLGLKADGSIVAWGSNDAEGQCNVPLPNSGFVAVAGAGSTAWA